MASSLSGQRTQVSVVFVGGTPTVTFDQRHEAAPSEQGWHSLHTLLTVSVVLGRYAQKKKGNPLGSQGQTFLPRSGFVRKKCSTAPCETCSS